LKQQSIFIGLDDTDTLESRGTGHLARQIATSLALEYSVLGVVRHQLLVDPRIPYTAKNSSAAILLSANGTGELDRLGDQAQALVHQHFNPGSDPGLCVAQTVPAAVTAFGRRVQQEVVTQEEARELAGAYGIRLAGLGGTQAGIIGALAAVGLAADGEDGRYVMVGRARALQGLHPISAVLAAGVAHVQTLHGHRVNQGLILTDKLRPARRQSRPVAVVEWAEGYWRPLRLD
jgi:tRNA(Ile2) C34 agmatinyltransferase TiaS